MTNRIMRIFLVIGLVGAAFLPAARAEAVSTNSTLRVAGQLTRIDGRNLTIVSTAGQEVVVLYTEATKISRKGPNSEEALKYEDLKVGQQVRAYYSNNDKAVFGIIIDPPLAAPPGP